LEHSLGYYEKWSTAKLTIIIMTGIAIQ